jgi:FdhD protein
MAAAREDQVARPRSEGVRRVTGGRVPTAPVTVLERDGTRLVGRPDRLAVEEPLEIRLTAPSGRDGTAARATSTLSITMRTPGHDFELVAGFLLSEGIVLPGDPVRRIAYCLDRAVAPEQRYNIVTAELGSEPRRIGTERHVVTSSACGVCGSTSIEAVRAGAHLELGPGPLVDVALLEDLPALLASGQSGFAATGGLHGAALVDAGGTVLALREDVGRHNAVDKVVGWSLLDGRLPLRDVVLVVSGRVSFEIVQKALQAGISFVAAVSAATNLAVRLAEDTDMTLVGFLRGQRCTVYTGRQRIDFRAAGEVAAGASDHL